jgi:protein TonB
LAGLEPPVALHEPEPRYPRVALGIHLGGTVALRVVVSEHGEVVEVDVLHEPSPGYGFAEAALAAVRARRYRPARLEGRPVACELVVRVHFRPRP